MSQRIGDRYEVLGLQRQTRIGAWHVLSDHDGQPCGGLRLNEISRAEATRLDAVLRATAGTPGLLNVIDQHGLWLITERPASPTLTQTFAAQVALPEAVALAIAVDVAQTLTALHTSQIAHGGLDPDSVILGADGRALLAECGYSHALAGTKPGPGHDVASWARLLRDLAAPRSADTAQRLLLLAADTAEFTGGAAGLAEALARLSAEAARVTGFGERSALAMLAALVPQPPTQPPAQGLIDEDSTRTMRVAPPPGPTAGVATPLPVFDSAGATMPVPPGAAGATVPVPPGPTGVKVPGPMSGSASVPIFDSAGPTMPVPPSVAVPGRMAGSASVPSAGAGVTVPVNRPDEAGVTMPVPPSGAGAMTVAAGSADAATMQVPPPGMPAGTPMGLPSGAPPVVPQHTAIMPEMPGQETMQPAQLAAQAERKKQDVLRYGRGVASLPPRQQPSPMDTAPGWDRPYARPKRPNRWRRRLFGTISTLTTLVLLAVVAFWLIQRLRPLEISGATVVLAEELGNRCDVQARLVGTITTNGAAGTVTYRWLTSDGRTQGPLSQLFNLGEKQADVPMLWQFSGRGKYQAKATLQILTPAQVEASKEFTYSCSG